MREPDGEHLLQETTSFRSIHAPLATSSHHLDEASDLPDRIYALTDQVVANMVVSKASF